MNTINKKCPKCGGEMYYYDGCLGYESIQCRSCHYDVNDDVPNAPCANCGSPMLPICGETECHDCKEQQSIKMLLEVLAKRQINKSFLPEYREKATIPEGLGIAIANLFQWDGLKIMETFRDSLEDANFHQAAAEVDTWIKKMTG